MSQTYQFPENVRAFLRRLRHLEKRDDRGSLAALRRGASESTRHLAWPVIRQCGGDLRHAAWTAVGGPGGLAAGPLPPGLVNRILATRNPGRRRIARPMNLTRVFLDYETAALRSIHDAYDWHQRAWDAFPHLDGARNAERGDAAR